MCLFNQSFALQIGSAVRKVWRWLVLACALNAILAVGGSSSPLPSQVIRALQQHDAACSHLAFSWHIVHRDIGPPIIPKKDAAGTLKDAARSANQIADKVSQALPLSKSQAEQTRQDTIQGYTALAQENLEPRNIRLLRELLIARDGKITHIEADYKWFAPKHPRVEEKYASWYGDGWVVFYGPPLNKDYDDYGPYVWATSGDGLLAIEPYPTSRLWLDPASYALLCGKNPLKLLNMQSGDWQLQQETPSSYVITSRTDKDLVKPTDFLIELDKTHENLPRIITIVRGPVQNGNLTFTVQAWKRYQGILLPSKVHLQYFFRRDPLAHIYEDWQLAGVAPTGKISIDIPPGTSTADCRLIGPDPTGDQLEQATQLTIEPVFDDKHEVTYSWSGSLPTLEQLRGILEHNKQEYEQQRPHRSSLLVPYISLVLGLGLIGSGVWLLRTKWKTKKRA